MTDTTDIAARLRRDGGISTEQWARSGMAFELWLRYAAADADTQIAADHLFAEKFPEIAATPQRRHDA